MGHAIGKRGAASLLCLVLLLAGTPRAWAADNFQWKQLTIMVGSTPSGGFDVYGRMLARVIGKYLPGQPNVVVENRPGAGGMTMMNYIYNVAPKDGSEIGIAAPGFVMDHVIMGEKSNARFDAEKFGWVGSMNKDLGVFVTWSAKQITLADVLAGKPSTVGAPGPGGNPWLFGRALNDLLGTKLKMISGYPGMAQVLMAIESQEIDGTAGTTWEIVKSSKADWLTSKSAQVILQYGLERDPELADVPNVMEIMRDESGRAAMRALVIRNIMGRPFFAPPSMPPERLATLRQAFDSALKSPEMIEGAKTAHLAIDWIPGSEVDKIVAELTHPSPDVTQKIRHIFED